METKEPIDLSVVIVNYNSADVLTAALDSVFASKTHFSYEVFVVDNNSTDGSQEMVRQKYLSKPEIAAKISLIENTENLGFGKGNNLGMKKAKGDYILLLNPDT